MWVFFHFLQMCIFFNHISNVCYGFLSYLDQFVNTCFSIWKKAPKTIFFTKNVDFYIFELQKWELNENFSEIIKNFAPLKCSLLG